MADTAHSGVSCSWAGTASQVGMPWTNLALRPATQGSALTVQQQHSFRASPGKDMYSCELEVWVLLRTPTELVSDDASLRRYMHPRSSSCAGLNTIVPDGANIRIICVSESGSCSRSTAMRRDGGQQWDIIGSRRMASPIAARESFQSVVTLHSFIRPLIVNIIVPC